MTNIRDFAPDTTEQYGAITVHRYPQADGLVSHHDHADFWRFSLGTITVDGEPLEEIWLRLYHVAITNYQDDETILLIVAKELLAMARDTDPAGVLPDGRKVADLKPEDLYASAE